MFAKTELKMNVKTIKIPIYFRKGEAKVKKIAMKKLMVKSKLNVHLS